MTRAVNAATVGILALVVMVGLACEVRPAGEEPGTSTAPAKGDGGTDVAGADGLPCPTKPPPAKVSDGDDIPLFAADSPFDVAYERPQVREGKRIWARSALYERAPELVVEKWLSDKPETEGKYVLVEFWATWCPPCRRSIALLNGFHKKFGKELLVIGISDETEEDVRALTTHPIDYYSAIDTQARMKNELNVVGIPHAIVIEPNGHIVWEGFPLLAGYELTDEIIEKVLTVGRKLRAQEAAGK